LNHRKYHGLLVASTEDFKRTHLVSAIEEKVETEGGVSFFLDSNSYANVVYPQGYKHILEYFPRPFPAFLYSTIPSSCESLILKVIQFHPALNFSVVRYRNLGKKHLKLILRPKFSIRDHHMIHQPGIWDKGEHEIEMLDRSGRVSLAGANAFVYTLKGEIGSSPVVYRSVTYPSEMVRGYDGVEDLIAPFVVSVELKCGEEEVLVFGDRANDDPERIAFETEKRYRPYPFPFNHPITFQGSPDKVLANLNARGEKLFGYADYMEVLKLSMQEFIADADLIAGFPWFSAWARDTLISMEALKYLDGGSGLAFRIFMKYGGAMKDGIVPNTLGEGGLGRNYEGVDSSLWFGTRMLDFWDKFDKDSRHGLLAFLYEIIGNYLENDSLPFHVDSSDGLISIRPREGLSVTWMDARVHGQPVTPRFGKPVEVNALWYNLLRSFLKMAEDEDIKEFSYRDHKIAVSNLKTLATKVKKSMKSFFYGTGFADRIEDDRLKKDIRPNYVIALSLPFDVFSKEEMRVGYNIARERLVTHYGLRTLSPGSRSFRKKYMGNQVMRDLAYHQGTVWVWLLLPMAKVAAKIHRSNGAELKRELERLISAFRDGFMRCEMASVPELYDGENPDLPKGAPAQCWSVAAVFVIEKMIAGIEVTS
jgi:predicted glycogen debranching enzyme